MYVRSNARPALFIAAGHLLKDTGSGANLRARSLQIGEELRLSLERLRGSERARLGSRR